MSLSPEDARIARAAADEYTDRVLQFPNVFGCAVGQRTVGGRQTGEASLVVFVERKLPLESLSDGDVLPREVNTRAGTVLVDVVERPAPRFGVDNGTYRPLRGGCQLSATANGGSGTLGAVMYDRRDAEVVLLTCNHVLTPTGSRGFMPANTRVDQPGGSMVGNTKRIVPWISPPLGDFGANLQARVDAGIVGLDPTIDAQFRVIDLGKHPYVPLPPHEGLEVNKRGFVTEVTSGTIKETDLTVVITDFNGQSVRIGGVGSGFSVQSPDGELFFQRGDSGSLVVDADGGAARGLMFAGDFATGGISYGCELGAIMEALELETPCTGSLNETFMRALRRRRLLSTVIEADIGVAAAVLGKNFAKFRRRYLRHGAEGSVGGAMESMLRLLSNELSEELHLDDDFGGLIDIALGDWLVQPTVFDLLEYRIPEELPSNLDRAFARFSELHPEASGYRSVVEAFRDSAGSRMRDVLTRAAPADDSAQASSC